MDQILTLIYLQDTIFDKKTGGGFLGDRIKAIRRAEIADERKRKPDATQGNQPRKISKIIEDVEEIKAYIASPNKVSFGYRQSFIYQSLFLQKILMESILE